MNVQEELFQVVDESATRRAEQEYFKKLFVEAEQDKRDWLLKERKEKREATRKVMEKRKKRREEEKKKRKHRRGGGDD
jgi:glutamate synthase domain-containing protein 3